MVSFDSKSYSNKLLHLISWSHWFTFFNIIAAIALSSYYLFSETSPDTLLGQAYLVTTWLSHIAFLTFMSFVLILFPLTILWPNTKLIRTSGSIIFTFGLLLLLLDGFIYSRLGYHLNASSSGQIINLIKDIAQESGVFYLVSGTLAIVILGFEFTVSNYAWKHLKQLQRTMLGKYITFTLVVAFFFSHLTHIWADANLDYDILRQDTVLPLSYPATAQTLLTKYGLFDIEDYLKRKTSPLSFSQAIPSYPKLSPLQCQSTSEINQSAFIIVIDEQLNEQQLSEFTRRASGNTLQLKNHIDTASTDDAWFNLFYSLPSIYQQDILSQQTKPLLFQQLEHQGLIASYTAIGDNETSNYWFEKLFNEQTQLADISSLIFAELLNNKPAGLHLIHFKSSVNNQVDNKHRYQFELFIDALLLAQKQKSEKDFIWISSIGNQSKNTQLSSKPALLIAPNNRKSKELTRLTSHMDLQPTLITNWLNCSMQSTSITNGDNLLTLKKDRVLANTTTDGIVVFNKDKSVLIDQNGNFQSYSSQLAAPITINKDFPLMIDGVHFIKRFSEQVNSAQ